MIDATFDADLVVARKLRAMRRGAAGADFLLRHACEDLEPRLAAVKRRFAKAATLFCWSGLPASMLRESGKADAVVQVEAAADFLDREGLAAAPEAVPFASESIDLAVSLLSMQDVNDLPGLLIQIRRALSPDGLFLGAMAGTGTLAELRDSLLAADAEVHGGASPRISPFADVKDIGGLLQRAGFALPVTDVETVAVRYDDLFALLRDLRGMGATSALLARKKRPERRAFFLRAAEIYAERHSDPDGRIRATFSFIWMSGWAPHASQQKPLKPGSATASLAQALSDAGKRG